jgi:hypothetical protein
VVSPKFAHRNAKLIGKELDDNFGNVPLMFWKLTLLLKIVQQHSQAQFVVIWIPGSLP